MVCCLDEESSSSPGDKTAADTEPTKTGMTQSLSDESVSVDELEENDSDAGSSSVKCTSCDAEDGSVTVETVDVDVETAFDVCKTPQLSMSSASSLCGRSRRLDGRSDGSDSDVRQIEQNSSSEDQRRASTRTATSPLAQVSPKRRKLQREDNTDGGVSGENDGSALHVKMPL